MACVENKTKWEERKKGRKKWGGGGRRKGRRGGEGGRKERGRKKYVRGREKKRKEKLKAFFLNMLDYVSQEAKKYSKANSARCAMLA